MEPEPINYATIERTYREIMARQMEPSLMVIRIHKKSKAVRRVVGRGVRRGLIQKGQVGMINVRRRFFGLVRV